MRRVILSTLIATLMSAPIAAQEAVVTSGPVSVQVGPIGNDVDFNPLPTVFAQTFSPAGGYNYLESFQFFLFQGLEPGGNALALEANVFAFDTDHLVGPALFSPVDFFGTDDAGGQAFTIGTSEQPLNWFLTPGQTYALVLSSINGAPQPDHASDYIGATDAGFLGGSLFYSLVTDPSHLTDAGAFSDAGADFGNGAGTLEAAGSATFSKTRVVGTPEPSTVVMLATGLIPLGTLVRRRRRAA